MRALLRRRPVAPATCPRSERGPDGTCKRRSRAIRRKMASALLRGASMKACDFLIVGGGAAGLAAAAELCEAGARVVVLEARRGPEAGSGREIENMAGAGRARRRVHPRPQPGALRDRPQDRARRRPAAGRASRVAARIVPRHGRRLAPLRGVDENDAVEGSGSRPFGRRVPRLADASSRHRTAASSRRWSRATTPRRSSAPACRRSRPPERGLGSGRARPVPDPLGLRRRGAFARGARRARRRHDPSVDGRTRDSMASEAGRRPRRPRAVRFAPARR